MSTVAALPRHQVTAIHPRHSLRTRLGLATGALTLLLALLISVTVGFSMRRQVEASAGQSVAELAFQMTDKLDRGMFERYKDVQLLAALDTLRDPAATVADQRALLESLQTAFPNYAWIGIADNAGVVQASTGGLLEGQDVSERPWFVGAQGGPYVGDVHEAKLLAKLLPNPSNEPLRFVDVAVPILDQQGQQRGVLGAHLSWAWAQEVQQSLLQPMVEHKGVEIFIVSRSGEVLLAPPSARDPQALVHNLGQTHADQAHYTVATTADGQTYLAGVQQSQGYLSYPGLGWSVVVRQPTEVAFAPARLIQQQIALLGLGLGMLFALLAWFVTAHFVQPLLAIASASDRIRQGDASVTLPLVRGQGELAQLATSLNTLVRTMVDQDLALRSSNAQLLNELAERSRSEAERERLYREAQAAVEARDEFLAVAAHELKTPVTSLRGFAQVLLRRARRTSDGMVPIGSVAPALDVIDQQSDKLTKLVEQLLDMSRLDAGRLVVERDEIDLIASVRSIVATAQHGTDRHTISVDGPASVRAQVDGLRIEQVLTNLIDNAIKYSPDGGLISVKLNQADPSHVSIAVQDCGIGIPVAQRSHIFDRFFQAHVKKYYGGMGLGLYISSQIVQLHGGTIHAEFPPEGGTRFVVRLPIAPVSRSIGKEGVCV